MRLRRKAVTKPVPEDLVNTQTPVTVFIDTETTGLEVWQEATPFAVGILWGDLQDPKVEYFEWKVEPLSRRCEPDAKDLAKLKAICANPFVVKCFHNAKFDLQMLAKIGVEVVGRVEDTSFAARVCNTMEISYGLKDLAWRNFDYPKEDMLSLKENVKKLRLKAKKLGWAIHPEHSEADYWLCQYVDKLMPDLPRSAREQIKSGVGVYCVGDVFRTGLLWSGYSKQLDEDKHYRDTYERELDLLRGAVMHMEKRGMAISYERTAKELADSQERAKRHLSEIEKLAAQKGREDFNPGSSKQLASILYSAPPTGYGLEAMKVTDSGADSTDWKALRPYADHPFVREVLAYRSSVKAADTFFQKYMDMMRPDYGVSNPDGDPFCDTHVLHPSLNQCGTVTGRFSCNNPNLQQVANSDTSARGTDPIQARAPFGPRPGYVWYLCDFAQMELRVFADIANVPSMLEAIFAGRDLNTENANRAWGGKGNQYALEAAAYALELGHDEPSKEAVQSVWDSFGWSGERARTSGGRSQLAYQTAADWLETFDYDIVKAEKSIGKSGTRGRSKCVTFCKIYGGGPAAVVDLLYCTLEEAKDYWKQYDRAFPEINEYIRAASEYAERNGYIVNKYGRKLRIDPRFSYRAVNYMIQGTCADLMKEGIRKCHAFLQEIGIDGHVLMTIHDELIFEIRKGHNYKWVLRELMRLMSDHEGRLRVPMPVEMKRCRERWDRKESVEP